MTMPDEIYNEMLTRCEQVSVFTRLAAGREDAPAPKAMGAIIRCAEDGYMTVECGQSPDDAGFVMVRRFDRNGEQMAVTVVELDGATLISG